ncbi:uncharacterized protein PHALS_12524 [Plasmopara halstedii]|uniref:Uncharacterized protein n=1 Tax=Plasmopara halstedii TaxID=4781 RepID=A0A0P1AM10_PLAHL|nr:uncharacterized protein PHALS_12524 [Plasmopara halstedii]CEG42231.1 hypothetical protein PHALS_12524 [Plasmopara halstedii]|eukprot:XP_024578600.1 hypothetical protein PHALS_12524 [Plasmopara halstedii]
MATQTRVSGQGKDYFGSWRLQKVHLPEVDTCSDGSARTVDEALDLEALDYMAATATQITACVQQLRCVFLLVTNFG